MKARWILPLVLVALTAARRAVATDAPHDASFTVTGDCTECHTLHGATGAGLTNQPTNFTLCAGCHDTSPSGGRLGLPWGTSDQGVPGSGGSHHHWDSLAGNPTYGATAPAPTSEMGKRVRNGYLQCSTCHDQHAASSAFGGVQHTSVPPGVARNADNGVTGCQMALNQPAAAAAPRGYRIEIAAGGPVGNATFRYSSDRGRIWSAPAATGANRQLSDGANVTVTFSGGSCTASPVPQRWDFYVSYPFLRISNLNSAMCESCHASRVMDHTQVESGGDGTQVFSHPVGVGMDANGRGYDRPANALLDANGALQATGDGIATNDLRLASDSTVRCMTCHYPHNADSNSLTEDPR